MGVMLFPNQAKKSEDCLFLNIFSPHIVPEGRILPVMIWIHGGGFTMGSANSYVPDRLVANGPVIVVTINYRLSVWGFLSTSDSNSPGNYGLWDQHVAIKWVHDNIEAFGGDPKSVTIFGESAGSASVIYQGLYKRNKELFQRIIGQSGAPLSAWAQAQAPTSDAKEFASLSGCQTSNAEEIVTCLRNLPGDVINGTLNNFTNGLVMRPALFVPSVDHDFIEETSNDIFNQDIEVGEMSRSVFSTFDLMIGANSGEGYLMTPPVSMDLEARNNFYPNRTYFKETLVPKFLSFFVGKLPHAVIEATVAEYTDWKDPENPESLRQTYIALAGDIFFVEPTCSTVDLHAMVSQQQSSYLYYFTLKPSKHWIPTPTWANKPNHGDELIYIFGGTKNLPEFGKSEKKELEEEWEKAASRNIMTMWTNFAKSGNPNKPRDLGIDWLPYTQKHHHYMDIARTMTSRNVKMRLDDKMVNFWSKIVPAMRKQCQDTSSMNEEGTCSKENECSP